MCVPYYYVDSVIINKYSLNTDLKYHLMANIDTLNVQYNWS